MITLNQPRLEISILLHVSPEGQKLFQGIVSTIGD